jgi:hypothetical protein
MSSQMHFIYSSLIRGVGMIAGGPQAFFLENSNFKQAKNVKVENIIN